MAKDPAMLFYTSDFLTGVTLLSMKERGQYITLLCLQQQMGHMSLGQMQTAVGRLSPALLSKYVQDEDGLYYNRRAEEEIRKRQAHCEKQRGNIRRRWSKDTMEDSEAIPSYIPDGYHGITTVIPLENENEIYKPESREEVRPEVESKDTTPKRTDRDEAFDTFWTAYPRKIGKQAARKAFAKVPKSAWPKLVPAIEAQKKSRQWLTEDGRYIPNPATWLNQGRWEDEAPEITKGGAVDLSDLKSMLKKKKPNQITASCDFSKRDVGALLDRMEEIV